MSLCPFVLFWRPIPPLEGVCIKMNYWRSNGKWGRRDFLDEKRLKNYMFYESPYVVVRKLVMGKEVFEVHKCRFIRRDEHEHLAFQKMKKVMFRFIYVMIALFLALIAVNVFI